MKKLRTRQTAISIFLGAIALSSAIAIGALYAGDNTKGTAAEASELQQLTTTEPSVFILRTHEGRLKLFHGSSDAPSKIYDFDISLLTEYDRNLLQDGIMLYSQREVDRLIEDLTT